MEGKTKDENIHESLKNFLTLSQFCGIFPIYNIRNDDPKKLKFKWISWKTFLTISLAIFYLLNAAFFLFNIQPTHFGMSFMILPIINIQVASILLSSVLIARSWRNFVMKMCEVEREISRRYLKSGKVTRKLKAIFIILVIAGFGEKVLVMIKKVHEMELNTLDEFLRFEYDFEFSHIPYHISIGIILWIYYWSIWFNWIVGDTFIIVLSVMVSSRYQQISLSLESHVNNFRFKIPRDLESDREFYTQIRRDYNRLASVCRSLNDLLSNIITATYFNNIAFILVQLFNSLQKMHTQMSRVVFLYSFIHVIARVSVLTIYAASIHEESRRFLPILNRVPAEPLDKNVERLIYQIHTDPSVLTGHNFFNITNDLVLKVATAVISYELVLIQFWHIEDFM